MFLFNKNKKPINLYDRDIIMAKIIIDNYGLIKPVDRLKENNSSNYEYTYEQSGLKIVLYNNNELDIYYHGNLVLSNNNYYVSGLWENVLADIYFNISKTIDNNNVSIYKQGIEVLHLIHTIGKCNINDNLVIFRNDNYKNNKKEEYYGTVYTVIYYDEVVFSGYYSDNNERIYVFEQEDEWIDAIKNYRNDLMENRKKLIKKNK